MGLGVRSCMSRGVRLASRPATLRESSYGGCTATKQIVPHACDSWRGHSEHPPRVHTCKVAAAKAPLADQQNQQCIMRGSMKARQHLAGGPGNVQEEQPGQAEVEGGHPPQAGERESTPRQARWEESDAVQVCLAHRQVDKLRES